MNGTEKRRFPLFWVLYALFVVLFGIALTFAVGKLGEYLTAFESSQPIYAAKDVFERYFSSDSFLAALEEAGYEKSEFESLSAPDSVLQEKREGKELSFYEAARTEEEICYNVVLTDEVNKKEGEEGEISVQGIPSEKLASIYLVRKKEPDEFGFFGYEYSRMEMFEKPERSLRVTLPTTSVLALNGASVSEEYVVSETEHTFNEFLPDGVEGITLATYEISGLYLEPVLSLTDRDGLPQELLWDEEKEEYVYSLNYNGEWEEKNTERVLNGMHEYAKYIQKDGTLGAVARYFDTSSLFYKNVTKNYSIWVTDHDGYEFQNESVRDFYVFDENTFCCRVSFDHVLKRRGKEDYVDVLDMIVFLRKKGNEFYIFDRIVQ